MNNGLDRVAPRSVPIGLRPYQGHLLPPRSGRFTFAQLVQSRRQRLNPTLNIGPTDHPYPFTPLSGLGDGNTLIIGGAQNSPLTASGCQAPGTDIQWAIPMTGKCYPPAQPPYLTYMQPGAFIVPISDLSGVIPQYVYNPNPSQPNIPTGQYITGTYVNQVPVVGVGPAIPPMAPAPSGSATGGTGPTTSPIVITGTGAGTGGSTQGSGSTQINTTQSSGGLDLSSMTASAESWLTGSMIGGIPNWMLIAGAVGAMFLLGRSKR